MSIKKNKLNDRVENALIKVIQSEHEKQQKTLDPSISFEKVHKEIEKLKKQKNDNTVDFQD